jgi:GNAT superfamily N-acetyltransferase
MDPRDRIVMATEADYEVVLSLYRGGGMQPEWAEVMAGNVGAPSWYHFMTLDGDKPVALASMYISQGFALCFPGMTLPAYRNRGYQRALASHRIAAAGELGCEWVSVNVDVTDSPLGFTTRTYTRLGFELLYVRNTHVWHQPDVMLPDAYSRRMLAPRG